MLVAGKCTDSPQERAQDAFSHVVDVEIICPLRKSLSPHSSCRVGFTLVDRVVKCQVIVVVFSHRRTAWSTPRGTEGLDAVNPVRFQGPARCISRTFSVGDLNGVVSREHDPVAWHGR